MRVLRLALPLLLLTASLAPGTASARGTAARSSALARRIEARLAKAGLREGCYGVAVLERGSRPRVVLARGQTHGLIPASVAKVLTAAAALDLLGPGHVFTTRLSARGRIDTDAGVLDGDLVLHGGGDPNFSGRLHGGNPMHLPKRFAAAVAKAGIREVRGALVLDEGPFDRQYLHPGWTARDRLYHYGAPVGGLSFNDNCVDVRVRGGRRAGRTAPATVLSTAGLWTVRNEIRTTATGKSGIGGRWLMPKRQLLLHGRVRVGKTDGMSIPVPDPAEFLGGALLHSLKARGVNVSGGLRRPRDDDDRRVGRVLIQHGTDIGTTLRIMNQRSQNFYAGLVFKGCGAALEGTGTWASGQRAVRALLARRHILDKGRTRIVDGSGLSLTNRVTAGVLAQVLASFDRDLLRGPLLYESLAVSGRSGTMRRRLSSGGLAGRVHAKTGTLNDKRVRSLAGYVDGRRGHPGYAFAIVLNGSGASHAVIDEVVRELCR